MSENKNEFIEKELKQLHAERDTINQILKILKREKGESVRRIIQLEKKTKDIKPFENTLGMRLIKGYKGYIILLKIFLLANPNLPAEEHNKIEKIINILNAIKSQHIILKNIKNKNLDTKDYAKYLVSKLEKNNEVFFQGGYITHSEIIRIWKNDQNEYFCTFYNAGAETALLEPKHYSLIRNSKLNVKIAHLFGSVNENLKEIKTYGYWTKKLKKYDDEALAMMIKSFMEKSLMHHNEKNEYVYITTAITNSFYNGIELPTNFKGVNLQWKSNCASRTIRELLRQQLAPDVYKKLRDFIHEKINNKDFQQQLIEKLEKYNTKLNEKNIDNVSETSKFNILSIVYRNPGKLAFFTASIVIPAALIVDIALILFFSSILSANILIIVGICAAFFAVAGLGTAAYFTYLAFNRRKDKDSAYLKDAIEFEKNSNNSPFILKDQSNKYGTMFFNGEQQNEENNTDDIIQNKQNKN
jgi:hypothetical protein